MSESRHLPSTATHPLNIDKPWTVPAQIHYKIPYHLRHTIVQSSLVFTRDLSGLDLATTPRALLLANEHNEKIKAFSHCTPAALQTFFSYPLRREFPEKYRSPPTIYARYILRPAVLLESRSTTILFDLEGRICPRRPNELSQPSQLGSIHWLLPYIVGTLPWHRPMHIIDALDLWDQALVNITIHSEGETCHVLKLGECSSTLTWERRLYERVIHIPHPRHHWWRPMLTVLTIVVVILPVSVAVSFPSYNTISGGAILAAISARFRLGNSLDSMDKRLCPVVPVGGLPCVTPANPDVAGIGVSFIYSHVFVVVLIRSSRVDSPSICRPFCS